MPFIQAVDIVQCHEKRRTLNNVNLSVNRGDVLALIGPTGAGKTTLIRILDLLERPYSGKVIFDGCEVTISRRLQFQARRRMAFVHQKPMVFTDSVFNNVACALRWRHSDAAVVKKRTEEILDTVGLVQFIKRNARTLSGGEMQRVAIARALVTNPEVLYLDEPTANLDPITTAKIEELLSRIIQGRSTTIVMTTHDMSQGQRLADKIGVLINGEILQVDKPDAIFCTPQGREVAEFVGVENILDGIIIEKSGNLVTVSVNGSTIQSISNYDIGDKVHVLIRPEDITFTLTYDKTSARNVFEGSITRVVPLGSLVRIEAYCGVSLLGVVTKRSAEELGLIMGKKIFASFKATALHTIKRWN
jgi:tungstate transport system ATP-binding protein